jgi:hypothetical protein
MHSFELRNFESGSFESVNFESIYSRPGQSAFALAYVFALVFALVFVHALTDAINIGLARIAVFVIMAVGLASCASTNSYRSNSSSADTYFGFISEGDEARDASQADGAAFGADSMTFRKHMPNRPKNNFHFYYKDCWLTEGARPYSKTSYYCN